MGDLTGYFSQHEFACNCGCGLFIYEADLILGLQAARMDDDIVKNDIVFIINSGTRCLPHNTKVDGSVGSSHLYGLAADIRVRNSHERFLIVKALLDAGFERVTPKKRFVHVDVDKGKVQEVMWL